MGLRLPTGIPYPTMGTPGWEQLWAQLSKLNSTIHVPSDAAVADALCKSLFHR